VEEASYAPWPRANLLPNWLRGWSTHTGAVCNASKSKFGALRKRATAAQDRRAPSRPPREYLVIADTDNCKLSAVYAADEGRPAYRPLVVLRALLFMVCAVGPEAVNGA